jgi:hypothetical protein
MVDHLEESNDEWNDDDDSPFSEDEEGCIYAEKCLCPHFFHASWECYTI